MVFFDQVKKFKKRKEKSRKKKKILERGRKGHETLLEGLINKYGK